MAETTSATFHVGFASAALRIPAAFPGQQIVAEASKREQVQSRLRMLLCDSPASALAPFVLILNPAMDVAKM
jgi:hypothetical protein